MHEGLSHRFKHKLFSKMFLAKKTPAAARRYNNKGFKQKKRLWQHGGTKTIVLVKKYTFSKND